MSNLEINKRIAELKGFDFWESQSGENWLNVWRQDDGTRVANWAEDISDAWTLFEEIAQFPYTKISFYNEQWWVDTGDGSFRSNADTAPRAICIAWIEWKEQNEQRN